MDTQSSQMERAEPKYGAMDSDSALPEDDIRENTNDADPPPDGGVRAWSQVFAGHLIVAIAWGYPSSFGVFQTYYEHTLPYSPSDISWIGGVQVFAILFISAVSGRATDAGLARPIVFLGSIIILIGTFTTSLATEYWQIFLAQGLCVGLGLGLIWLPSITLISHYFVRKRVLALTTAATGTSTGGMIFPAMIQYLTPKIGVLPPTFQCSRKFLC
jgi:MFS transporter, MCT family, solute carrier family 16 (monocarboxylic acid transporters), member 3